MDTARASKMLCHYDRGEITPGVAESITVVLAKYVPMQTANETQADNKLPYKN